MKIKAAKLSPLAQEMADVQSGKTAPGRVWIVKRRPDGTVDRRQVSRVTFKRKRAAESEVPNTALPARRAMGVSQDRFAELLGISPATVRNIEQGRTKPTGPTSTLLRIAEHHPEIFIAYSGADERAAEALVEGLVSSVEPESPKEHSMATKPMKPIFEVRVARAPRKIDGKKTTPAAHLLPLRQERRE